MWFFKQSTGALRDRDLVLRGMGWAGRLAGKNNPAMQNIADIGPLPRGFYTIGEPHEDAHTGPYTMSLTPDAANQMFGRSLFKMHGAALKDPELSSEGCIIMVHPIRELVWSSGDHRLQVIA